MNKDILKECSNKSEIPKILIYNWVPFDNPWKAGGGVNLYCKNVIEQIIKENSKIDVYFLSSGFAFDATTTETYIREINNIFGEKVHQYEVVNSPIPAEQRNIYRNPLVALENLKLKKIISNFIDLHGNFRAIHFNNIEGLSLDILDLKEKYKDTKFIFSMHNYIPLCIIGSYYMRHKNCNCNPSHTYDDCFQCTRVSIKNNIAIETYNRGLFGLDPKMCIDEENWIKALEYEKLDKEVNPKDILKFSKIATEKLNKNCDSIIAVSKRVYDICIENGIDSKKLKLLYIGTKVAENQIGHSTAKVGNYLKIIFLGNDMIFKEKGYQFLVDTLSKLDSRYASKIDLCLTIRQPEYHQIFTKLKKFHSVGMIRGYTQDNLREILKDCNLSIVPVLWEDNLPQIAIESVAYGVPVLASSSGGSSELCASDLFKFECGNSKDLLNKIIYFVENPEKLEEYWKYHEGLVTMSEHLKGLYKIYNFKEEEIKFFTNEESHISKKERFEEKFLCDRLKNENKGKIIYQTDYYRPKKDFGINLFKLELENFNFSDFYAEINFVSIGNINKSRYDTLHISGTWYQYRGKYRLELHQYEWENSNKPLKKYIYYYIRDNTIYFWGKYLGHAAGYNYQIRTLTNRSNHESVNFQSINNVFEYKYERKPKDALNYLPSNYHKKIIRKGKEIVKKILKKLL